MPVGNNAQAKERKKKFVTTTKKHKNMKTYFNKIAFMLVTAAALTVAGCTDKYEYEGMGAPDAADNPGVYFATGQKTANELDPQDPTQISIVLERLNTKGALQVPVLITSNDENKFEIAAAVSFADGEKQGNLLVNFPQAEEGKEYSLSLRIPAQYVTQYKKTEGLTDFKTKVIRLRWETLPEKAYWVSNVILAPAKTKKLAMAVEVQKAQLGNVTKFRFNSPYAFEPTEEDTYGYVEGWPYNKKGSCDGKVHKVIIEVDAKGNASMQKVLSGTTLGLEYGMFSFGTAYGQAVKADPEALKKYPLGRYDKEKNFINFAPNSLFVYLPNLNGGKAFFDGEGTQLFLSPKAYADYLKATTAPATPATPGGA